VSRKRPGEYLIRSGSFIGGGGSTEATPEKAAEYLSWSPHWAHLMRLTLEMGWHERASRLREAMRMKDEYDWADQRHPRNGPILATVQDIRAT
jgi:hypothetical protein